ncbi:APC family permease [Photobacterium sagamiensis]|uniref:APC family permease n=1 Tax=Photobacterium sagamiensis TaxID=2910241 RepID=UPI003D0E01DE
MVIENKAKLGLVSIILFVLSGLIGIDGLAPAAAVGPSVFGWWAVVILLFVIPYVFIVCELGSAFPGEGGIYEWTYRGLGAKNAARVSWYYWINVPFWIPSVYLICSGMIAELFFPDMSTWAMIAIAIVLVWLTVFTANASLNMGTMINALGGLSKVAIIIAFAVGGYMLIADQGGVVNELTLESMKPSMEASFMYAPTLIYMFVGVETIACMGSNIRNPQRNLPLGILIAVSIIVVLYWVATSTMISALPLEELSLVGGIVQTFNVLFGNSGVGQFITMCLSLLAIVGLFTYIIPWVMASSRAAAEAASNGEMPAVFAKKNKHGSPYGANMMTGYVATLALIVYGFMAGSADELFWSLFSFANFLLFITYFFFFATFIKLRQKEPDVHRPFKVPGGNRMAVLVAILPSIILFFGCLLFVFPDILLGSIDWDYSSPTFIAIVIALVLIEYSLIKMSSNKEAIPEELN